MIPGFATVYRDAQYCVHLYFFRGIDDDGSIILRKPILRNLSEDIKYKSIEYPDNAVEFIFENDIRKINCSLINIKTNETENILFEKF